MPSTLNRRAVARAALRGSPAASLAEAESRRRRSTQPRVEAHASSTSRTNASRVSAASRAVEARDDRAAPPPSAAETLEARAIATTRGGACRARRNLAGCGSIVSTAGGRRKSSAPR
jgi:hypothetical protein